MKRKNYSKHLILACAISSMAMPTLAQADTQIKPAYSSSSEALSAEQQAQQKANRTHTTLDESLTRLNELEDQKRKVQGSGNSHQIMATETALKNAGDMYMDQLSHMTGVSLDNLEKMHDAGVSYQDMTSELGVQAHAGQMAGSDGGAMGDRQGMEDNRTGSNLDMNSGQHGQLGLSGADSSSMMGARTDEIMNATARNTESGWSEGHGSGMQTNTGQDRDGGMMAGAGGLSNGMGTADDGGHDGGMGASGSDNSGSSGMGGSSGGSGGSGSSGGGHGGGSGGGGGGMM